MLKKDLKGKKSPIRYLRFYAFHVLFVLFVRVMIKLRACMRVRNPDTL